jgi:branched-chain amino acid transport system ATP-binding protein
LKLLEVMNVSKRFGGIIALNSVSMHIESGEILGLIGPNGSGKTTLINVISGFYKCDNGKIFFKGTEITHLPTFKRSGIARTFQVTRAFENLTTIENVILASYANTHDLAKSEERALEILEKLGLSHRMDIPARNLTLLERKRLELARAMAREAELLLLDEVMAGLKPYEIDELAEVLKEFNERGTSMMIVEHVMRSVRKLCNRVIVLHEGVKIAEGSFEEVSKDPNVRKAYLGEE